MNKTDIISITILALFALFCYMVAFIFNAWWHVVSGTMCLLLAGAIYCEEKK